MARQTYYGESLSEVSTTGTAWADAATATFTPDDNSTYFYFQSAAHALTSTGSDVRHQFLNTTSALVFGAVNAEAKDATDYVPIFAVGVESFTTGHGAQALKSQISGETGVVTARIREDRIVVLKKGANDDHEVSAGDSTNNTNVYQDKINKSFTPGSAGEYLIIAFCNRRSSSTGINTFCCLDIDGDIYGEAGHSVADLNTYRPWGTMVKVNLTAAAHTIKLKFRSTGTATATVNHAVIIILRLSDFVNNYYAEDRVRETHDTNIFLTQASLEVATPASEEHLILACGQYDHGGTTTSTSVRLQEVASGTTDLTEILEEPVNSAITNVLSWFVAYRKTLAAESHTWNIQHHNESGTIISGIKDKAIAVLQTGQSGTAVSNQADLRWDAIGRISCNLDARWNLIQRIAAQPSLQWNLHNTVGQQSDLRWQASAAISRQARLQWNLIGRIAALVDARWNLAERIEREIDLQWVLQEAAAASLDSRWNIRNLATAQEDLRWNTTGRAGAEITVPWHLAQLAAMQTDCRWDIRARAGNIVDLRWNAIQFTAAPLSLQWHDRQLAGGAADLRWHINQSVSSVVEELELVWRLAAQASGESDCRWNLRNIADSALDVRWHVTGRIAALSDIRWALRELVASDPEFQWNIGQAVNAAATLLWHERNLTAGQLDVSWHLRTATARVLEVVWQLRQLAGTEADLRWALLNEVAGETVLLWDNRQAAASEIEIDWHLIGRIAHWLEIYWNTNGAVPETARSRTLFVKEDSRIASISADARILAVPPDNRTATVSPTRTIN